MPYIMPFIELALEKSRSSRLGPFTFDLEALGAF